MGMGKKCQVFDWPRRSTVKVFVSLCSYPARAWVECGCGSEKTSRIYRDGLKNSSERIIK